jgi:hypothetical protein
MLEKKKNILKDLKWQSETVMCHGQSDIDKVKLSTMDKVPWTKYHGQMIWTK